MNWLQGCMQLSDAVVVVSTAYAAAIRAAVGGLLLNDHTSSMLSQSGSATLTQRGGLSTVSRTHNAARDGFPARRGAVGSYEETASGELHAGS